MPPSRTREQLWSQQPQPPPHPTHDLEGSYLGDAHTVWLVVERGCVIVHISNLDIHLPSDHLGREVQGSTLSLPLASSHPCSPGTC